MRRTLLLTAAVAVAATVAPALAAPAPVDSGPAGETTLVVPLGHGESLQVDVSAAALSSGDVVRVVSEHCGVDGSCDSMDVYQSSIPASALSIDSSTAQLRLRLAGRDVQLQWRAHSDVGDSGGADVETWDQSTSANNYQGSNADVTATIDGLGCETAGVLGKEVLVDSAAVTGAQSAGDLSAFRIPADATIGCG